MISLSAFLEFLGAFTLAGAGLGWGLARMRYERLEADAFNRGYRAAERRAVDRIQRGEWREAEARRAEAEAWTDQTGPPAAASWPAQPDLDDAPPFTSPPAGDDGSDDPGAVDNEGDETAAYFRSLNTKAALDALDAQAAMHTQLIADPRWVAQEAESIGASVPWSEREDPGALFRARFNADAYVIETWIERGCPGDLPEYSGWDLDQLVIDGLLPEAEAVLTR